MEVAEEVLCEFEGVHKDLRLGLAENLIYSGLRILPKRLGGKGDTKNGIDLCIMCLGSFDIKDSTPSVLGVGTI